MTALASVPRQRVVSSAPILVNAFSSVYPLGSRRTICTYHLRSPLEALCSIPSLGTGRSTLCVEARYNRKRLVCIKGLSSTAVCSGEDGRNKMDPIISNKVVHGPRYGGKWDSVSVYHGTFDPTVPPDIKSRFLEWKEKEEAKTEKEAEREREKAQERERRHKEFAKDDKKIIPHPVPVIPPYQKIPSQQLTAEIGGSSKQTNQHHLEYQKQKAQPKSVKELQVEVPEEPAKVVEVKSGPATPMKSGRVSIGVSPLQAEGMKIVQASEGPEAVEVNVPEMGTCGA